MSVTTLAKSTFACTLTLCKNDVSVTKPRSINEGMVALTQVGCNRFLNALSDFPLRFLARRCVSVLSVGIRSMILYRGSSNARRGYREREREKVLCIVQSSSHAAINSRVHLVQLESKNETVALRSFAKILEREMSEYYAQLQYALSRFERVNKHWRVEFFSRRIVSGFGKRDGSRRVIDLRPEGTRARQRAMTESTRKATQRCIWSPTPNRRRSRSPKTRFPTWHLRRILSGSLCCTISRCPSPASRCLRLKDETVRESQSRSDNSMRKFYLAENRHEKTYQISRLGYARNVNQILKKAWDNLESHINCPYQLIDIPSDHEIYLLQILPCHVLTLNRSISSSSRALQVW